MSKEPQKYTVAWSDKKRKTCKLCQRKEGYAFCKRHGPRMTVKTIKFSPEFMDVSTWKKMGKKFGYWDYFEEQTIEKVQRLLIEKGHGGGNWRRLIFSLKNMIKK